MSLSPGDIEAIWLTLKLAIFVTFLLIIVSTPIAWWLAKTHSWLKAPVNAIVAMPLVLPPTVLGFYLLIFLGPSGALGSALGKLGISPLPFSFQGLVVASMIYSLPFVVQPIQNAFTAMGNRPMEVASTLRSSPFDRFLHVALPLAKPGYLSAAVLGFAHTVGEFGVVLMMGGNIEGETRVLSVQIYDHVEALEYNQAHLLALMMVVFAFVVLALLYALQKRNNQNANIGAW